MGERSCLVGEGGSALACARAAFLFFLLPLSELWTTPACAQDERLAVAEPYRRQMTFTYQYFETEGLGTDSGTLPSGRTYGHAIDFEFNQALGERWMLTAGLPLITKRYEGMAPHTPWTIVPPRTDSEFLDDGDYHSDLQDLRVGIRYLATDGPLIIEPFAMLGVPSHDYTFFAQAAVGPQLDRLELGVDITYQPPFSNFFFKFAPSRELVEETLGYNVDHWRLDAEVGYFVNAAIDVRFFVSGRDGNGLSAFEFPRRDDELWYHHDQITRHNYLNAGAGVDWALSDRNRLTTALLRMVHAQDVHALKYAVSIGMARSF